MILGPRHMVLGEFGSTADVDALREVGDALDADFDLLPACGGIEATRLIHELNAGQHIVIYTGSDEFADVVKAEAAGAVGYLNKDALTSPDLADALVVLHRNHARSLPDPT